MHKEAIEKIEAMSKPQLVYDGACAYSAKQLYPITPPMPNTLAINTLDAMKDYIEKNVDTLNTEKLMIHIESPSIIHLYSEIIGAFQQRPQYLMAQCPNPQPSFSQYLEIERFIIQLNTMFVNDDNVANLIKLVGNIQDGKVRTVEDDGLSQQVSVKVGAATLEEIVVPNPVILKPYRTFLEVDQPASPFLFRLKSGHADQMPTCALFEADGGMWRLEAMANIKTWFDENLPGQVVIA